MNIFFDFEISQTLIDFNSRQQYILDEIKDFIYQRLKILETEMAIYNGAIMVNVFGTLNEQHPLGYAIGGYPKELTSKIQESLTEQDFEYVYNKIMHVLGRQ